MDDNEYRQPPSHGGSSMTEKERQQESIDESRYNTKDSDYSVESPPRKVHAARGSQGTTYTSSKESRTMAALNVKEEQYQQVNAYNMKLLSNMNDLDDDKKNLEVVKLALESENQTLRETNFEMQSKVRSSDVQLRKSEGELEEKGKQHKIMTDHNTELLRLIERLECDKAALSKDYDGMKDEFTSFQGKYASLLSTAKTHEHMATQSAAQGALRAEKVRLLEAECEQLRNSNTEIKMKSKVEVETLQDQVRGMKEKQYQLLQHGEANDELRAQAEDQVAGMEEKLRSLHEKKVELETQLQVQTRGKRSQQDANKSLLVEVDNYARSNSELQEKIHRSETERIRIEAESRDTSAQLTEMSSKIFQLLEKVKMAELGKTKAIEEVKRKEQEMVSLKKKNKRMIDEATRAGKAKTKAELDKKVLEDQNMALKKHNGQLNNRCCEEVNGKLKAQEECKKMAEKNQVMSGRLSFLLSTSKAAEESKIIQKEEVKKLAAQLHSMQEKNTELVHKSNATGESNRVISQAMRMKQEELESLMIRYDALQNKIDEENLRNENPSKNQEEVKTSDQDGGSAKGYFYIECKSSQGLMILRPKAEAHKNGKGQIMLDTFHLNAFLKRAQKSVNVKQMLVEKIGHFLSLMMNDAQSLLEFSDRHGKLEDHNDHLVRKLVFVQERLVTEEDAKRRVLLRYVHSVKNTMVAEHAEPLHLQLSDSGIGDEEMHALAAQLRGNTTLRRIALKNDGITDTGACALAVIFSGAHSLSYVDLRGNNISEKGIKVLSEALERNTRIRHVYVHGGGKIEGLGISEHTEVNGTVSAETQCTIDVRDNDPPVNVADDSNELIPRGSLLSSRPAPVMPMPMGLIKPRLSNAAVVERKKEVERARMEMSRQRKSKRVETKKKKESEARWAGRDGGINNLPPLESVDSPKKTVSSMSKKQNETGYVRRLKESPLAK